MILSWIGLILGAAGIIVGQVLEGGHLIQLVSPTAGLIVFGGTLGATLLSSSLEDFTNSVKYLPKVFLRNKPDFRGLIKQIVSYAVVARREGILSLDKFMGEIQSPFLKHNLQHVIDGFDPNVVREIMEERIELEEEHKLAAAKVWEQAGGFSPTIGIIGAVLGLIHVMANLSDASKLGAGIAVAFVATVYGVGLANLVLLPIANKLKKIGKDEMVELKIIYTAVLGIQNGLNPRIIEDRLNNLQGEYTVGELERTEANPTEKAAA